MFKDVNIDRWIEPRYNHAPIKIQKEGWMIKSNLKKDDFTNITNHYQKKGHKERKWCSQILG